MKCQVCNQDFPDYLIDNNMCNYCFRTLFIEFHWEEIVTEYIRQGMICLYGEV